MFLFRNVALLFSIIFTSMELTAQNAETGPVLKSFLASKALKDYTPSLEVESGPNFFPTYQVVLRNEADHPVLWFHYQVETGDPVVREHIFNMEGRYEPLLRGLSDSVFAEDLKEEPAARVFLRTIWTSFLRKKLVAMTLATTAEGPESTRASLYLIKDPPETSSVVAFVSAAAPPDEPSDHLPLIVLEFHPQLERNHLHYLRYLIPVQSLAQDGDAPSLIGVNLQLAHESLSNFRRFAVAVDVQKELTTIYPSLYDGREIISDVTLEIYALSNYIQGFLDWFVQIWWREFPQGRAIHMKRGVGDKKFLDLSLYRYRAQLCSAVVRSVTRN